jgi:IclR helix-turn-helix domain
MPENAITIELSKAQVNRVVRENAKGTDLPGRVGVIAGIEFRASPAQVDDRRCSRSFLRGLLVLACFPADGTARSVKDLAKDLEMAGSTTHRYISTLVAVGLLERDPRSRQYRLAGSRAAG